MRISQEVGKYEEGVYTADQWRERFTASKSRSVSPKKRKTLTLSLGSIAKETRSV